MSENPFERLRAIFNVDGGAVQVAATEAYGLLTRAAKEQRDASGDKPYPFIEETYNDQILAAEALTRFVQDMIAAGEYGRWQQRSRTKHGV